MLSVKSRREEKSKTQAEPMLPGGFTRPVLGSTPCEGVFNPLSIMDMEIEAQLSFKSAGKVLERMEGEYFKLPTNQLRIYQGDRSLVGTLVGLSLKFDQFYPGWAKHESSVNEAVEAYQYKGFSKRIREID